MSPPPVAFGRLPRDARAEVSEEGERLAAFLAPDAGSREVRFETYAGAVR